MSGQAFQIADYETTPLLVAFDPSKPAGDQVLVRIRACALNFSDLLMIKGKYQLRPTPPVTLGMELAGDVLAIGDEVRGITLGDRVAVYSGQGGLATHGCFAANRCVRLPDSMPYDQAAGFLIAYGTSHLALKRRARLQAGETLLVLGAAGGVGLTAVEIGKRMGATVIACARGPEKLAIAQKAGADHLIDSDSDDITEATRALGRADVVYDAVGGDQFRAALRAIKPEGRILAIGFASGDVPQIPANHLLVKNVDVLGLNFGAYLEFHPEALTDTFTELLHWYEQGGLRPHISHRFPLDRAADALDTLRARKSTGKIIVEP